MAVDMAPELLEKVEQKFKELISRDKTIRGIDYDIKAGKRISYKEANTYAEHIGMALSSAFKRYCYKGVLPNETMYYNIADRVMRPMLKANHKLIADVAEYAQNSLNKDAGVNLKAIRPALNESRTQGLIDAVSAREFEKTEYILGEPIVNYSQSIIDDAIKQNVEFHYSAGFEPRITRKLAAGCCEWCAGIAGEYKYPNVPDDFYRRHEYCRCTVIYEPSKGKYQGAHSKRQYSSAHEAEIEERKLNLDRNTLSAEQKQAARNERVREARKAQYSEEEWAERKQKQKIIAYYKSKEKGA